MVSEDDEDCSPIEEGMLGTEGDDMGFLIPTFTSTSQVQDTLMILHISLHRGPSDMTPSN